MVQYDAYWFNLKNSKIIYLNIQYIINNNTKNG